MKRIIIFPLLVLLLFGTFSVGTAALTENGPAAVTLDEVSASPGQRVSVNVTLTENPGITGLRFFVAYDASRLTLEKADYTKLGGGGLIAVKITNNPVVLLWNVATYEFTDTGVLAVLTFLVKENAAAGECPLTVTYGRGDCIDVNLKNLDMHITNGKVNVLYNGTNCPHENTEERVTQRSTCTLPGETQTVCRDCGSVIRQESMPVRAHVYGAWTVEKGPTDKEEGLRTRICAFCGDVQTELIEKLPEGETSAAAESTPAESSEPPVTSAETAPETAPSSGTETDAADTGTEEETEIETAVPTGDNTVFLLGLCAAFSLALASVLLFSRRRSGKK